MSGRSDTQTVVGTRTKGAPARPVPRRVGPVPPGRPGESRRSAEPGRPAKSRSTAEPGQVRSRQRRPAQGGGRIGTGLPGTGLPGTGRPGTGLPAGAAGLRRAGRGVATRTSSRTPFIFLVVGLLGGGLLSLLVINTILAAGSYEITALQKANAAQTQQVATLSQQVAVDRSPTVIERRALQLGMVQPPLIKFLDLKTGRITSQPATDPGIPSQPGWSP